jgi:hypothetical protein
MNTQIQGDNIIQTTTVPLSEYVARKQNEVRVLQERIEFFNTQLQSVLTELSNLIEK